MTRRDLIRAVQATIAERGDVKARLSQHEVASVIDATFEHIFAAMRDEGRYAHPGFGTFAVKRHPPRSGFNPRTGERVQIAESARVRFKPSRALIDRLGVTGVGDPAPADAVDGE